MKVEQHYALDDNNGMLFMGGMKLKEHMASKGIDRFAMASRLNVTPEAVRLWMRGERTPRPEIMARIAAETNGAVTANDFVPPAITAPHAHDARDARERTAQ